MEIRAILNSSIKKLADDTLFSVTFLKKDGTLRHMVCRTGVSKYLNPNSKGLSERQKESKEEFNLLTVYDNGVISQAEKAGLPKDQWYTLRPYRDIPCDRILEVKARGLHFKRKSIEDTVWELTDTNV